MLALEGSLLASLESYASVISILVRQETSLAELWWRGGGDASYTINSDFIKMWGEKKVEKQKRSGGRELPWQFSHPQFSKPGED